LTLQQELELAEKIKKGDAEARERMINSNLRLVVASRTITSTWACPALSGAAEVVRNQGGRIPPRATALLEPAQVTAIRHFAGKLAPPAGFEPAAPGSSTYDFRPCRE
jgi:hypothetical protein